MHRGLKVILGVIWRKNRKKEGAKPQRQTRGQGRRTARQNTARETVSEQTDSGMQPTDEQEVQEPEQEQAGGMVMGM
jgi:hypothetical protein